MKDFPFTVKRFTALQEAESGADCPGTDSVRRALMAEGAIEWVDLESGCGWRITEKGRSLLKAWRESHKFNQRGWVCRKAPAPSAPTVQTDCPFCGADQHTRATGKHSVRLDLRGFQIECAECGARGPIMRFPDGALREWKKAAGHGNQSAAAKPRLQGISEFKAPTRREIIAALLATAAAQLRQSDSLAKDAAVAWRVADAGAMLRQFIEGSGGTGLIGVDEPTSMGSVLPRSNSADAAI